jgi:SulP family sulfate permease
LYGALFFGAVKLIEEIEDKLCTPVLVIDLKNVIYVDSSGADALVNLIHTCHKRQVQLIVCGLMHQPMDIAQRTGLLGHLEGKLEPDLAAGMARALSLGKSPAPLPSPVK